MTQPSLTTTFDTSLVDLSPPSSVPVPVSVSARVGGIAGVGGEKEGSFSTTETEVSDDVQQQQQQQQQQQAIGLGLKVSEIGGGGGDDDDDDKELESKGTKHTADGAGEARGGAAAAAASAAVSECSVPQKASSRAVPQKHRHTRKSSSSSSSSSNSRKEHVRHDEITKTSAKSKKSVLHMPTEEAYDAWASTYDTDCNFLQAVDDAELQNLLPTFLTRALACYKSSSCSSSTANDIKSETKHSNNPLTKSTKRKRGQHEQPTRSTLRIVDLGCGTGRNLVKMLMHPWPPSLRVRLVGLDFSNEMLNMARKKCGELKMARKKMQRRSGTKYDDDADSDADADADADVDIELCRWDFSSVNGPSSPKTNPKDEDQGQLRPTSANTGNSSSSKSSPLKTTPQLSTAPIPITEAAHAVLSTLVAEHLPLPAFFQALKACVRVGGIALLTNMHPDMGQNAQAAFVDAHGNEVLSGESWIHGVREMVDEAKKAGFEILELNKVAEGSKVEKQDNIDADEIGNDREDERERVRGVREVLVEEDMVEWLGERSRKWIGTKVWFGMMLRRLA